MSSKKASIRNNTSDFLIFSFENDNNGIEVRIENKTVWLTENAIAKLYNIDRSVVNKHVSNILEEKELEENSTCAKFAQVAANGKTYQYNYYSLEMILSVGYRTNSNKATEFRKWATQVLSKYTREGYVLDKERLINGKLFDDDYFDKLIEEIQEIRASERRFYQKITDLYALSSDYDKDSKTTKEFFSLVQNKMHYAVTGETAAEIIMERADHSKEHMGLTSWKNAPDGKVIKSDVSIAKNYLQKEEIKNLNEIVEMYLDYANRQAKRHIVMTMEDWKMRLDAFLKFNEEEILEDKGKVKMEVAKAFAESEYEKYRVIQDKIYKSDFDKLLEECEKQEIIKTNRDGDE